MKKTPLPPVVKLLVVMGVIFITAGVHLYLITEYPEYESLTPITLHKYTVSIEARGMKNRDHKLVVREDGKEFIIDCLITEFCKKILREVKLNDGLSIKVNSSNTYIYEILNGDRTVLTYDDAVAHENRTVGLVCLSSVAVGFFLFFMSFLNYRKSKKPIESE